MEKLQQSFGLFPPRSLPVNYKYSPSLVLQAEHWKASGRDIFVEIQQFVKKAIRLSREELFFVTDLDSFRCFFFFAVSAHGDQSRSRMAHVLYWDITKEQAEECLWTFITLEGLLSVSVGVSPAWVNGTVRFAGNRETDALLLKRAAE